MDTKCTQVATLVSAFGISDREGNDYLYGYNLFIFLLFGEVAKRGRIIVVKQVSYGTLNATIPP